MDRENEIRAFKPEEYWTIEALLKKGTTDPFSATLIKINDKPIGKFDIKTKNDAEIIAKALQKASLSITSIKRTEVKKNPLPPFTTSTLQQTASSRLKYSAKKTMMLAQRLYENGYITYMRTDAVNLSHDSVTAAKEWLTRELGQNYALPTPRIFTGKSKLAQEAHEAIRPTNLTRPEEISVEDEAERKLYRLIWQRFLACQMPHAVFDATSIDIDAQLITNNSQPLTSEKPKIYTLRANGNIMKFDGFLKIYPQTFEEKILPQLTEGPFTGTREIKPLQHFTEPPPRFTEARLIKTLEEFGIGRPSTYVPIISVIQSRNYVRKEAGRFTPTEIGEMVNKMLVEHFPDIVDINFTASMEEKLDLVAAGTEKWQELLAIFYKPFNENLEKKYALVEKENPDEKTDIVCEKCGKPMVIKFGRFGKFLACTGFPDCKNTKNIASREPKKLGLPCPTCVTGELVERFTNKGRRRVFWGCSRYPECDYATWKNPLAKAEPDEEAVDASETES